MAAEPLNSKEQKKIIRTLTRLKHSLAADREIYTLLEERDRLGIQGVIPRIETSLQELTNEDSGR